MAPGGPGSKDLAGSGCRCGAPAPYISAWAAAKNPQRGDLSSMGPCAFFYRALNGPISMLIKRDNRSGAFLVPGVSFFRCVGKGFRVN